MTESNICYNINPLLITINLKIKTKKQNKKKLKE